MKTAGMLIHEVRQGIETILNHSGIFRTDGNYYAAARIDCKLCNIPDSFALCIRMLGKTIGLAVWIEPDGEDMQVKCVINHIENHEQPDIYFDPSQWVPWYIFMTDLHNECIMLREYSKGRYKLSHSV